MDLAQLIQALSAYAIPVLLSITLHEAAHGYVARHFGDNTAWLAGRITLNPLKHIDPFGTILLPLLLYFVSSGGFLFGYAKPVPVRFDRLHKPKHDMVWVALAGPISNFVQALLWGALVYVLASVNIDEPFFVKMVQGGVWINVLMCVFNLFPLPPLDGGRVLVGLLPGRWALPVARLEPWGMFIVLALAVTGLLSNWWLQPLIRPTINLVDWLLQPLVMLLG